LTPVPVLVTLTDAPGITAPDASRTAPVTRALNVWAETEAAKTVRRHKKPGKRYMP
jgi:hypothetical protein